MEYYLIEIVLKKINMKKLNELTEEDSNKIVAGFDKEMKDAMDFDLHDKADHEAIALPSYPLSKGAIKIVNKLIELGYETGFEIKK